MMNARLHVARLEDRLAPAAFGIPWASPAVTLSFMPDGAPVSGTPSSLFASLNQNQSTSVWQRDILRAYQAWVRAAAVDVADVGDDGSPAGALGRWQGDPRFGDIRIAAAPLGNSILALGTPPDPGVAGTRAGDVTLNATTAFDGQPYDLFSVMLHEAGHSLGVGNSADPAAVMFTQYAGLKAGLAEPDLAAIRALYGPRRPDALEGPTGNGSTATATDLGGIAADRPDTLLVVYGDLTDSADRDVFSFVTPGSDPGDDRTVAIKLQTTGFSLLTAKLTVYSLDGSGQEVERGNATISPDSFAGGAVTLTFDGDDDDGPERFYIRVERSGPVAFDVGRYAVAISTLDNDDGLDDIDLRAVAAGPRPVLINADAGGNNSVATATPLTPRTVSAVLPASRYEVAGSISAPADADHYRVVSPAGAGPRVLTVSVLTPDAQAAPSLAVFDLAGAPRAFQILANAAGLQTIQVPGLAPATGYVIRVSGPAAGSYQLTADFTAVATPVQSLAQAAVPGAVAAIDRTLVVSRPATVNLLLSATAANAPAGVLLRLTLLDHLGNALIATETPANDTTSSPPALLRPGRYRLRIEAVRPPGYTAPIHYQLRGAGLDDPIGIQPKDPSASPTRRDDESPRFDAAAARRKLASLLTLLLG